MIALSNGVESLTTAKKNIFIVDDHPVVREGLGAFIDKRETLSLCGTAENIQQALEGIAATNPDLVLVDVSLDGESGLELIRNLKALKFKGRILVSSMHDEALYAPRALEQGAHGYVMKGVDCNSILDAMERVLEGHIVLSEAMQGRLLDHKPGQKKSEDPVKLSCLSNRELQIFEMIGKGMSSRKIASVLRLSPKTVDRHRENIKTKLHLRNSIDLIQQATMWLLEQPNGHGH